MKTIGLIGGMSWESTITYYQVINETVKKRLGGLHSAKLLLYSVDFYEIEQNLSKGEWDRCADILVQAAQSLEKAGAEFIVICTNTMHKVVPQIQERIGIPILHIVEAAAEVLKEQEISRVALLGTKYTMTQTFYRSKLEQCGIEVVIPNEKDIELINNLIFQELCFGIISDQAKKDFLRIIDALAGQGAQGVILGCTEIGLLIKQEDTPLPVFDTTLIHGAKAAAFAIDS